MGIQGVIVERARLKLNGSTARYSIKKSVNARGARKESSRWQCN